MSVAGTQTKTASLIHIDPFTRLRQTDSSLAAHRALINHLIEPPALVQ